MRNGPDRGWGWARQAARGAGRGRGGGRGLVGLDKDWMDQYRGFLFWKGPRGHPCPSSHDLRPWALPSLGLPWLCLAKLVWQVPFLPEHHPQIQAWFLLGVLRGATDPSLQRLTPLQGQEVEAGWVGVKGGHACFLELEGALVNLTCACQVVSVVSDSLQPYGL